MQPTLGSVPRPPQRATGASALARRRARLVKFAGEGRANHQARRLHQITNRRSPLKLRDMSCLSSPHGPVRWQAATWRPAGK